MTDHIFEKKIVIFWPHEENNLLKKLGEKVLGQVPTFDSLRPLQSWIIAMSKTVKQIFSSRIDLLTRITRSILSALYTLYVVVQFCPW